MNQQTREPYHYMVVREILLCFHTRFYKKYKLPLKFEIYNFPFKCMTMNWNYTFTLRHLSLVLFENLYSQKNSNKKQKHMKTSIKTKQIL